MVAKLSVAGGGCWRKENSWPWLRIREQRKEDLSNKGCLVLDNCLLRKGSWKKKFQVELQGHKSGILSFELWVGQFQASGMLQFVTEWSMDLDEWIQAGAARRWFKIQESGRDRSSGKAKEPEFYENGAELLSSSAYVCVDITCVENMASSDLPQPDTTMVAPPAQKSPFQFVLPHRSLVRIRKLRAVRVEKTVNELRTDILHDLLPLTLYGHNSIKYRQRRSKEPKAEIAKALILLQLSCQYANYCVGELNRYSSKLEKRKLKLKSKTRRMEHRHTLLKEQKTNLQREAEVLSCSLNRLQSLLEELDPQTFCSTARPAAQSTGD